MTPISDDDDGEVKAISLLLQALKPLDANARARVLDFVFKKLDVKPMVPANLGPEKPLGDAEMLTPQHPAATAHRTDTSDIRTLAREKNPSTQNERVALVAYYLDQVAPENEAKDFITSDDVKSYFIQAGFELPTALSMALNHAKNAGYLNALGSGKFRLNAVGHNLIAHKLPTENTEARKVAKRKKK